MWDDLIRHELQYFLLVCVVKGARSNHVKVVTWWPAIRGNWGDLVIL